MFYSTGYRGQQYKQFTVITYSRNTLNYSGLIYESTISINVFTIDKDITRLPIGPHGLPRLQEIVVSVAGTKNNGIVWQVQNINMAMA